MGIIRVMLTIAVAATCLTACNSESPPDHTAHPPVQFLDGPCPSTPKPVPELAHARCGTLVVPEDRSKSGGRTLGLAVAIVPSETQPPADDPIIFLNGGPGEDDIADPPIPQGVGINKTRDLILLSQRGNLSSKPALPCPEIDEFYASRVGLVYDAASTKDGYVRAVTKCRDRLSKDADVAAFNSREATQDLIDLRNALGIKQWNVFSHSYGTDLGLIYLRHDRDGIRSIALDGLTPPSVGSPGWTWSSAKEAFDNMTKACAAQPACQARYPNLTDTFIRMVNQLEANPVTTTVNVPDVGDTKVVLDGGALLNWFVPVATHLPATFPAAVEELAHGNPKRVAEQWASAWVNPSKIGFLAWGVALSVWCSEWVPFETVDDQLQKAKEAFPGFPDSVRAQAPQLPFLRDGCAAWNVPKAPDDIRDITNSDLPALVLSGSFDGQTGAQWGRYVAQNLSNSTVVEVPGEAHGVLANPCGAKVIASFFDNPKQPDTGCVNTTQPPPYEIIPPLP